MKTVQINTTCGAGSTGRICKAISEALEKRNIENYILFSSGKCGDKNCIKFSSDSYAKIQALKSRIFGNYGFNSKLATKKLISEIEKINPDIVHIHNIHSHDCNIETLFSYLKEKKKKIIWTFHDCWAFTAYCPHFEAEGCEKWKEGCKKCPVSRQFSWFSDKSEVLFERKKKLLSDADLTVVTPSEWLKDKVGNSFLRNYPIKVINNGTDLSVFRPTENGITEKFGIDNNKFNVLGVAYEWSEKKGIDVFSELAGRLDGERYRIILVGKIPETEKGVPENIVLIPRTQNVEELAAIYTKADVFVNPTREDTFPTVNIEALACQTPVVTFNAGGSTEIITDKCGASVTVNDVSSLEREIIRICETAPFLPEDIRKRAEEFDRNKKFEEYAELYESLM